MKTMERRTFRKIKCPYCFSEFEHTEVCFKARTVFTQQDIKSMAAGELEWLCGAFDEEEQEISRAVMQSFEAREDQAYKHFWMRYPGSEPDWPFKHYPVITPDSASMMKNGEGYFTDAGGFTIGVEDYFGGKSEVRICPFCHNELPSGYGRYPVFMIAVVGITSSGKTVYLSRLMKEFSTIMGWAGMGALKCGNGVDRFLKANKVERNTFLPQGTLPEQLSEPLIYSIRNAKKNYTLVFYDVAGENCVDPEKMKQYSPFIRNADGLVLLLDPEQFSDLRKGPEEVLEPEAVLGAMCNAFIDMDNIGGRSDKPLALVLSKSDILRDCNVFGPSSNIFRAIPYTEKGFQEDEFNDIQGELWKWMSGMAEGAPLLNILDACFEKYGLFAVSALDKGVEQVAVEEGGGKKVQRSRPVGTPSSTRIEEPVLWLLAQKGLIPAVRRQIERKRWFWR